MAIHSNVSLLNHFRSCNRQTENNVQHRITNEFSQIPPPLYHNTPFFLSQFIVYIFRVFFNSSTSQQKQQTFFFTFFCFCYFLSVNLLCKICNTNDDMEKKNLFINIMSGVSVLSITFLYFFLYLTDSTDPTRTWK